MNKKTIFTQEVKIMGKVVSIHSSYFKLEPRLLTSARPKTLGFNFFSPKDGCNCSWNVRLTRKIRGKVFLRVWDTHVRACSMHLLHLFVQYPLYCMLNASLKDCEFLCALFW